MIGILTVSVVWVPAMILTIRWYANGFPFPLLPKSIRIYSPVVISDFLSGKEGSLLGASVFLEASRT